MVTDALYPHLEQDQADAGGRRGGGRRRGRPTQPFVPAQDDHHAGDQHDQRQRLQVAPLPARMWLRVGALQVDRVQHPHHGPGQPGAHL